MARLAHGPQVRFVVAFWSVAEVRYGNTNFDLTSASPGSCPRPTDFFATTAVFQAFAETLASHTATCGRRSLPNIRSDLFPILWVITRFPSFTCASSFCSRTLTAFAANGFPCLICSLTLPLARFRCWTHRQLSVAKMLYPFLIPPGNLTRLAKTIVSRLPSTWAFRALSEKNCAFMQRCCPVGETLPKDWNSDWYG
jgi:hypothetical protein